MEVLSNKPLRVEKPEKVSGLSYHLFGQIPELKKKHYRILTNVSVGGDAPKELLGCYTFKAGKRQIHNPQLWDLFIAKTGHKWYPYESITEYLLNRIGTHLGLKMADAKLAVINGQIRFLSRLFLNHQEQALEHGAELYGGYLNDLLFVENIEKERRAKEFFTVLFTYNTLKHLYPNQAETLFEDFIKLLVFDAIIGNNDRHFYNWGIIKYLRSAHPPSFAPIYDTARALCWHTPEEKIKTLYKNKHLLDVFLRKYVENSKPKTGIENQMVSNHFDLIRHLNNGAFPQARAIINSLINKRNQKSCCELMIEEMRYLMSRERLSVVNDCLYLRFERLLAIIK